MEANLFGSNTFGGPLLTCLLSKPSYNESFYNESSYNEPAYNESSYNLPSYNEPSYVREIALYDCIFWLYFRSSNPEVLKLLSKLEGRPETDHHRTDPYYYSYDIRKVLEFYVQR